jgi:1-acyl-sn-glycerol-3-phosphate acyltransferase
VAGTAIPVVPCYLHNAHRAWPKGAWLARPRRVQAIFGPPRRFDHVTADKQGHARVANELHDAVQALQP